MIEKIRTKGFKGQTVEVQLGPKTLIVGPNGSGKSALVQALELVLTGQITGMPKTVQDIAEAGGAPFMVEVELGGNDFQRAYRPSGDGYAHAVFVNRIKSGTREYDQKLGAAGPILIWNPESFFALGPGQQIEKLVGLFGITDLDETNAKLEDLKTRINRLNARKLECERTVGSLLEKSAVLKAPPGSLAEVADEIKTRQDELKKARQDLADRLAKAKAESQPPPPSKETIKMPGLPGPIVIDRGGSQITLSNPQAAAEAVRKLESQAAFKERYQVDYRGLLVELLDKITAQIQAVQCPSCKGVGIEQIVKITRVKLGKEEAKAGMKEGKYGR